MRIKNLFFVLGAALLLNSCWIGDQDDPEILYDTTIIEVLCQTPELSTFCELIYLTSPLASGANAGLFPEAAWKLQFAGRTITNGIACPTNVETVFAPSNDAFEAFLSFYPQWNTIYDIPQDTVNLIVRHHIFDKGKMNTDISGEICNGVRILGGPQYDMWYGEWQFLTNPQGEFIASSLQSGTTTFTPIVSPDISSTDGAIYIIEDVIAPF